MRAPILIAAALLAGLVPARAVDLDFGVRAVLERLALPVPDPARPVVCHGFGCAYQTPIVLRPGDIAVIRRFFAHAEDATDERRALAATIAWFEKRVAVEAGTGKAKARAGIGHAGDPSQFDCLDKTSNTIEVMTVLTRLGLMRYHVIDSPESRGGLGSLPHTTAVMRERATGQKWAVDGWTHNNGEYPDIMKLEMWREQS